MEQVFFSIIIPTYNRALLLKRCLDSILAQTYQNWEAIIVDNYSVDNTEEIVMSYNEPRFRYVKNHNYGVIAVSRNKALDIAQGDWIAFLDSDDCWFPNKLEYVLPYLKDYDLVYHGYRANVPKKNWHYKVDNFFYEIKEPTIAYVLERGDPINPSCSCVSRKIIGETRFCEERELIAVEDYDFFIQLLAKNIRIKYLHVVLTLYDVGGCSQDEKASERDAILFKKWEYILSEDQKKEVHLQYLIRKSNDLISQGRFSEVRPMCKEIMRSKIFSKKFMGFKLLIKCLTGIKTLNK